MSWAARCGWLNHPPRCSWSTEPATGSNMPTACAPRFSTKSWSEERQAFAESFGGHELDASVLLMVEVGLSTPNPRVL